jgi:hypothetical protein
MIRLTCLTAAGLLLPLGAAHAAVVAPSNADFETGSGPFGSAPNQAQVTDWFEENDDGTDAGDDAFAEVLQNEDANSNIPADADGTYWLNLAVKDSISIPAVYQQIGTFNTGDLTTLRLSADLGDRSNQPFGDVTFTIASTTSDSGAADGTLLSTLPVYELLGAASFDFTESGSPSTASTGDFDINIGGADDGDLLWLRISAADDESGSESQNLVDDITVTAVPEPASLALLGLGGLCLIGRRRR